MRLPEDKKLVAVKYTYEDGSVFTLNEENALNFQNNIKSTSILSVRGNHYFAPVDWNIELESEKIQEAIEFNDFIIRNTYYAIINRQLMYHYPKEEGGSFNILEHIYKYTAKEMYEIFKSSKQ